MLLGGSMAVRKNKQEAVHEGTRQIERPMLSTEEILEYVHGSAPVPEKRTFSVAEARRIGDALGVSWDRVDLDQFAQGLNVELEHGRLNPSTDITHDRPLVTGKIVLVHLNKIPDYYTRLAAMVHEAIEDAKRAPTGDC
jgi:hypothetical protein